MENMQEKLYEHIIEYYNSIKEISPSIIQREFKLGYNRAYEYYERLQNDKTIPRKSVL